MEINKTLDHRLTKEQKVFTFKTIKGQEKENLSDLVFINQSVIDEKIESNTFVSPSLEEIKESLDTDMVIGVYHQNQIVAFFILLVGRASDRELGRFLDYDIKDCLTIDNVLVHKDYRGYGIEKELIRLAKEFQEKHQYKHLLAAVSKFNTPSLKSFLFNDFKIIKSDIDIYGSKRELLEYELK